MTFKKEVFPSNLFAGACADEIIAAIGDILSEKKRCSFFLSGGGTPVAVFKTMAVQPRADEVEWEKVDFFYGDERWVPSDDAQSNYKMSLDALLSPLKIDEKQIHRIDTSLATPQEGAAAYEGVIKNYLSDNSDGSLDLLLLGMGDDGHTASLFPGSNLLSSKGTVGADRHPESGQWRISLLPDAILNARKLLVMVKGRDKAEVIARVFAGDNSYPITLLKAAPEKITWLLDSEAASALPHS